MEPFRKILCATDLSEAGDVAILEADRHARAYEAELVVMHVVPTLYPGAPMTAEGMQAALVQLERVAAGVSEELASRTARLTGRRPEEVTAAVEAGVAHAEIVRKAEEIGADLVVVASAGTKGWRRLFLGSVATRVVRAAHTSVLVARPRPGGALVVVGTDLSENARPALALAAEEARRFGARLMAVHSIEWLTPATMPGGDLGAALVVPELLEDIRSAARKRLEQELATTQVDAAPVLTEALAAEALARIAEKERADLIVVGTLGRTGLRRVILGSVAEAVARDAPCPVLVARPRHGS